MCNTCFNRFSRSKNSFLILTNSKVCSFFKIMEICIQINIDRWFYVYDDF